MNKLTWHKSSFSGIDGNSECVEVAATADALALRESDEPHIVLAAAAPRLAGLLNSVKSGHFDQFFLPTPGGNR